MPVILAVAWKNSSELSCALPYLLWPVCAVLSPATVAHSHRYPFLLSFPHHVRINSDKPIVQPLDESLCVRNSHLFNHFKVRDIFIEAGQDGSRFRINDRLVRL